MKKTIYRAEERGFTNLKWLKSYHTFNFANYYEEDRSGFGSLLVLNEDSVQPGSGYGNHKHDNVEIISIPLDGSLAHKDDFGNESIISRGKVQVISAGKGLTHAEYNPSRTENLHFLEIWFLPDQIDGEPRHQILDCDFEKDKWASIIHPDRRDGSLSLYLDACLCLGKFEKNIAPIYRPTNPHHGIFMMILKGKIQVMEEQMHQYDAIALEGLSIIHLDCLEDSDILLIEIPMVKKGNKFSKGII